jgi:hypothetical protein
VQVCIQEFDPYQTASQSILVLLCWRTSGEPLGSFSNELECPLPPVLAGGREGTTSKRQKVRFERATDNFDVKLSERVIQFPDTQRFIGVLVEGLKVAQFLAKRGRRKITGQEGGPNGSPVPGHSHAVHKDRATDRRENGAAHVGKHHTPKIENPQLRGLWKRRVVEKSRRQRRTFPPHLEIPHSARDSHFAHSPDGG